ncbi:ankyrin repeat-containing protein BDA1 [Gossypium hirsutum]|uniref:Ankyrin repeat-containing protein BDA1 n=1 Tax=Gossypium hirsutum TaxID=3635 RepID=A0ABM3BLF0_GOSHI|nr:ankyrin repeat-containing protein BDA1-like [Gossypium hirsutum]
MTSCGKLREAVKAGNIDSLYAVIRKDPYILDRIDQVPFIDTPVHVAVTSGQDDFAVEVMNLKPSLARKLNTDGYSPIHLAIQNERMVLRLLEIDKDLVRVKGREGYTPLHCAAEQGNLRLLAQLLVDYPEYVRDVTIRSETALHIAAKNNKLEAVQVLAQSLRRTYFYSSSMGKKLLNWKDKDGNTALHVAAYNNQPQRDSMKILCNAEALNASLTPRSRHLHQLLRTNITGLERALGELFLDITNMSTERSSAVLVILVLILTSTYQATLSPPGGVLQADSKDPTNQDSHGFAPPKTLQIYGFKSRYMYIYHSRSSKFRIEGDKKYNHMNSEGGKLTLNSRDFLLFYVPNTIAFIMTFILTLGLLAVVANGITWLLLPPLLLLYFCLLSSTFAISPANAPVVIDFAPLLSLPIMFRVIGHAKCLRKYTG